MSRSGKSRCALVLFCLYVQRVASLDSSLVDVAVNKPVLETFSGSGLNATSSEPEPPIGWFSMAFGEYPDHSLYPETLLVDLLDVYLISSVSFGASAVGAGLPRNFSISVGLPGSPYWTPVDTFSSLTFSPLPARYVRLVVTAVAANGPNYTIAVPHACMSWGCPTLCHRCQSRGLLHRALPSLPRRLPSLQRHG